MIFWWIVIIQQIWLETMICKRKHLQSFTMLKLWFFIFSRPFLSLRSNCQSNQLFFSLSLMPIILYTIFFACCVLYVCFIWNHVYLLSFNCWKVPAGCRGNKIYHLVSLMWRGSKGSKIRFVSKTYTNIRFLFYWFLDQNVIKSYVQYTPSLNISYFNICQSSWLPSNQTHQNDLSTTIASQILI